jgi:hypothetical protein
LACCVERGKPLITVGGLGRRVPVDFNHVSLFPMRLIAPVTVPQVERTLTVSRVPQFRSWYDQGVEGACCGFAASWMMTLLNDSRYAARWLYQQAQLIDYWPDTPPAEGTSVRHTFDILRDRGHRRMWGSFIQPEFLANGIAANRWATDVDELRTSIALRIPGVLGINWYQNFDVPVQHHDEWWIGLDPATGKPHTELGKIRGGHAICYRGASDMRQAFRLIQSWGTAYPDVWIPYEVVQRLIREDGEVGLVTDR